MEGREPDQADSADKIFSNLDYCFTISIIKSPRYTALHAKLRPVSTENFQIDAAEFLFRYTYIFI